MCLKVAAISQIKVKDQPDEKVFVADCGVLKDSEKMTEETADFLKTYFKWSCELELNDLSWNKLKL